MKIDPDDPILTAYALGELDEAEREAVEARLEQSPEARRAAQEILQTANLLTQELANEPPVRLTPEQRELIEASSDPVPANAVPPAFWRRPTVAWGFAAAACVALGIFLLPQRFAKTKTSLAAHYGLTQPEI